MAIFDTTRTNYDANGALAKLGKFFADAVGAVVAWNEARVTRHALNQLSTHELKDIGLIRGDIDFVASNHHLR